VTALPRVGIGWDLHRLAAGRRLVLGGVVVPHDRGTLGHSDGDPLLHALCDAVLGAAGLGDMGERFPPSDPRWKDADSAALLRAVVAEARAAGWATVQADATVLLERPRLGPHRAAIRARVAALLGVGEAAVNIKAKTAEGLGPVGAGEAVEAHAVVVLAPVPRRARGGR
jgi:2-C-methyl-D-erythritol 2,4-cyclodiphosphate synthase